MPITRNRFFLLLLALLWCVAGGISPARRPWKTLIVDGQNNHRWRETTPLLKQALETSGLFSVTVLTSPTKGEDMSGFRPGFHSYDLVVLNYNGDSWPSETQGSFVGYVENGGGVVVYHAANNAFPEWPAYNEIIGLGGWGNRNEKDGPMVRWREGRLHYDWSPSPAGTHGPRHPFRVTIRDQDHPITKGLPVEWMHASDELYSKLRGPARNLAILATAYASPERKGTGEHEPILFTVRYGKGRIFHTVLGHDAAAVQCAGFITTLQRGAEWAVTGKVTQKIPDDFPTAERISVRPAPK